MEQALKLLLQYTDQLIGTALAVSMITLGILNYRRTNQIKKLKEENERLKAEIQKESAQVNPESDRLLLAGALESVQIMGINSLGPLHHCREEVINFLSKKGILQMLLLDPNSDAFKNREEKAKDSSNRLVSEWRASVTILKDIQLRTAREIELRIHSEPPDRSLFIVDATGELTERTKMLINYYPDQPGMRGYCGSQFLAEYVMERDRDSIFKNKGYFAKSWEQARPIAIDAALKLANHRLQPTH